MIKLKPTWRELIASGCMVEADGVVYWPTAIAKNLQGVEYAIVNEIKIGTEGIGTVSACDPDLVPPLSGRIVRLRANSVEFAMQRLLGDEKKPLLACDDLVSADIPITWRRLAERGYSIHLGFTAYFPLILCGELNLYSMRVQPDGVVDEDSIKEYDLGTFSASEALERKSARIVKIYRHVQHVPFVHIPFDNRSGVSSFGNDQKSAIVCVDVPDCELTE